jgi:hypothetical protein
MLPVIRAFVNRQIVQKITMRLKHKQRQHIVKLPPSPYSTFHRTRRFQNRRSPHANAPAILPGRFEANGK